MTEQNSGTPDDNPFDLGIEVSPEDVGFFWSGADEEADTQVPDWSEAGSVPEVNEDEDAFVDVLRGLRDRLGIPEEARVMYPGSASHTGVALVFGKERVMHVDPSERDMEAMRQAGYLTDAVGMEAHEPAEPYDVMVALNSYGSPTQEAIDRLVRPGGIIIANNYTHWAHDLRHTDASLIGAILPSYNSPEELLEGIDLDESITDIVTHYYHMPPGGALTPADGPGEHVFADEAPRFPDALFVFQRPEQPDATE